MSAILIDTSAIFAFVNRMDYEHKAALAFTQKWVAQNNQFVLPDIIFAESMTLLKARLGADIAIKAGSVLRTNSIYRWTALDADTEAEAWTIFQHYRDKEWSFVDCAMLALARKLKLAQVFSYDHHFEQMPGLRRVG